MRIFIGILVIIIGYLISWKSEWMLRVFGRVAWAEEHLGLEGGTRLFYKFLGIIVILLGIFAITGILTDILNVLAGLFIKK